MEDDKLPATRNLDDPSSARGAVLPLQELMPRLFIKGLDSELKWLKTA